MAGKDRLTRKDPSKVFNDPIHGHIELHPLCVKIIDTPQFQRLRFLKQLGVSYFVYPGASHNRFEHSLGVCYLAGRLVRRIQRQQPDLGITDKDVLCVQIAGLCHDLGHGPFSHVFDTKFIPAVCPDSKWKHEQASVDMFEYLVRENKLEDEFKFYKLDETDQKFIKEQIVGVSKQGEGRPLEGRPEAKYLYEVVANKRNGIDVDKWDYFARDCHMLGIKNNFDHNRCIHFARVLQVEGEWQICCRDKEIGTIYDMFYTRTNLHRRAYQHKTTNIIEYMLVEALVLANDHIVLRDKDGCVLRGKDGKTPLKMSEAINDMTAFSQLTDDIFSRILHSHEPELAQSREILRNILTRKLYKFMSKTQTMEDMEKKKPDIIAKMVSIMDEIKDLGMTENDIVLLKKMPDIIAEVVSRMDEKKDSGMTENDIVLLKKMPDLIAEVVSRMDEIKYSGMTENDIVLLKKMPDLIAEVVSRMDEIKDSDMTENDIVLLFVNHNYGMKERNPVDNVRFYSKEDPDVAVMIPKEQESSMLPENFKEQVIRIYSKKRDRLSCNMVKVAFERWCADNKFPPQKLIRLAKGKPNSDPGTSLLGKRTNPSQ